MPSLKQLSQAVDLIRSSRYTTAFTGAGVSVESGIPPFRGEKGLWNKYDPKSLDLEYFYSNPLESWKVIAAVFYEFFGNSKPNKAHQVLARMEQHGLLKAVITQNIDNLHQEAGSQTVIEFHGNAKQLVCTSCYRYIKPMDIDLTLLPVTCDVCSGLVKPDFIFFGEGIPTMAYEQSIAAAEQSEVMIVVGTMAEVMPAAKIPAFAKSKGATIIEVNPEPSRLTAYVTDIHLQGTASQVMTALEEMLF